MTATRVIPLDPARPSDDVLEEAARILRLGGLVAFATETVYGLGAIATAAGAVARIFEAKGRPAINPLIVHVTGREMASRYVADWPEPADRLAEEFWPGPLTLVLPRSRKIPDIVTAGRDTVAVRAPRCAVALLLIEKLGMPIAAPSANRSAGVSPTLAKHVLHDLDGKIDLILDSGPTALGLESTVVDLTTRQPHVLRPGPIGLDDLRRVLPYMHLHETISHADAGQPRRSPGQLPVHYAPSTRTIRIDSPEDLAEFAWPERGALVVVGVHEIPEVPSQINRFDLPTPELAARGLYAVLHECDEHDLGLIVVVPPPDWAEWHAIRDRLGRATIPQARAQ